MELIFIYVKLIMFFWFVFVLYIYNLRKYILFFIKPKMGMDFTKCPYFTKMKSEFFSNEEWVFWAIAIHIYTHK